MSGKRFVMKRIAAPKHWMLDKMGGHFAAKPSGGPHRTRESVPLAVLIRNKMSYALNYNECNKVCKARLIKVDGKVRTNRKYPAGLMDVLSIEKTGENFRLVYDTKGRFKLVPIEKEEAQYKLCKVRTIGTLKRNIPYLQTMDGRTVRYPHPDVKRDDTAMVLLESGKVINFLKFEIGKLAIATGGSNVGRIGTITRIDRLPGKFDLVYLTDAKKNKFSTRIQNVFVIGENGKPWVSIPSGNGVRKRIVQENKVRIPNTVVAKKEPEPEPHKKMVLDDVDAVEPSEANVDDEMDLAGVKKKKKKAAPAKTTASRTTKTKKAAKK